MLWGGERAAGSYRHTFLANDMGTGKTKTYLSSIVMYQRSLQRRHDASEVSIEFRPTLVLTPVNSILQTYREAREPFPDLEVVVYYGTKSSFYPGATVLRNRNFDRYLKRASKPEATFLFDVEQNYTMAFYTPL